MYARWLQCLAGLVFILSACLGADRAAAVSVVEIAVYPPEIRLTTSLDRQRYLVSATRDDGVTYDVTGEAVVRLADAEVARLDGQAVYPLTDGQTQLLVEWQGHAAAVPVTVEEASAGRPVSFHLDVMPVLMRTGCNTGACHGAARGKDGFHLSLFGYDPLGDYHRITREWSTRRINLAIPERSLLLEKAVAAAPHTGGQRMEVGDEYYATLHQWLDEGARLDEGEVPRCVEVQIFPPAAVLEGEGTPQQFIVRAVYSDGTDRDVTGLAVFMTSNDNSVAIDEHGLATAAARGEAFVMARFDTHTVGSQVLVLPADARYTPPPAAGNYIDRLIGEKLRKLRMLPSELCSDEDFLRRVTIDITGLMPTEEEYHAFLADPAPDKRARLIDRLLERKEFAEIWGMKWAEVLMVKSSNQVSYKSMYLYNDWLTGKIAQGVPLDEMVREVLAASGGTFSNPATNYYEVERDTLKTAENTAQIFMGIRTQCAQCHNHPFDRWTMDDYYSFAAFFSQVGRKQAEDYRETIIFDRRSGDVRHPVSGQVMPPKYLGGEPAEVEGRDRRETLAEWLTSPENPYFATSVANRVWEHFFGRGIVHPVDDFRVSNPPSNPQLLEALAERLVEYRYDLRQLVRDICNSHAYQRSAVRNESNEQDEANFASAIVRRIPAEQLLDCLIQVTEGREKFRGLPLGSRAVQIADGRTSNFFLDTFGRSDRETVCTCEASTDPTLSQALHLLNGTTVHNNIRQGGLVRRWLQEGKSTDEAIDAIYIRCLSRRPTDEERKALLGVVAAAPSPQEGLEDVFWAVLNSREFLFNH